MQNFGIIGIAGYVAPRHMKAIKDLGHRVVVGYDISDSVGLLDSVNPEAHFYRDFERFIEFVANSQSSVTDKVDYIVVCSPNYLHRSHVSAALRLGCNVICEKPLVPTADDLDYLADLEAQTGKRVWNILQLRHHATIKKLHNQLNVVAVDHKHEVDLTYITSRGRWYQESWKSDFNKSFGIEVNIGIHFFDLLHHLFGEIQEVERHYSDDVRSSGYIELERARVKWFLSVSKDDLKFTERADAKAFRSIVVDGKEVEFSNGFEDLHTVSYQEIIGGRGFGIDAVRPCIETTEHLRRSSLESVLAPDRLSALTRFFLGKGQ